MNIYIHKDGTQYGPYTLEQLQEYIQQGSFTLQDLACHDGQNWVPVGEVPGIAPAATSPAQPAAQAKGRAKASAAKKKTATAQAKQTTTSAAQPTQQAAAKTAKSGGSKKWIIFGGVGVAVVAIIAGVCIAIFSGGDEPEDKEIAGSNDITKEEATSEEDENTEESTTSPTAATQPNIALIDRIPSDAGGVIFIRLNDLLDKGRDDIKALLPPGLPPMVGKALEDPSSLGIDISQPLQIHLIPQDNPNLAPSGGIAGKLSDKEKFMTTLELLAGLDAPEQKDGYLLYQPLGGAEGSDPQIAIGSDFFFAGGADKPSDRVPTIEKFMTADGSSSLTKSNQSFVAFKNESHDLSIWFGGDSILETLGSQIDNANLDNLKGGTGTISLNFEDGELVAQMKVDAPNNEMVYGKGSFSDGILNFAPADAILALGFALDLQKFVEIAEKEVLPEFGDDIKLNEPMPELGGLSIRDAIGAFKGEFLVSLTDVKMPDPGSMGGFPGGPPMDLEPGDSPFSDPEMEEGDIPFPAPGGTGGFPGGGPPSGGMDPGAMMMASMPKPEFIVAASIDTEKWLKLKAAPPLAMGLGLAMMQGISITEKDDFLLIASKDHIESTQSGSVKNPVSGSEKELFTKNDFVLKINVAPILKMDLPIPPGGPMEMLKDISHLEVVSNSGKSTGTGTMRLVFTDKNKNSLSQILKIVKAINTIVPQGMNGLDGMDEEFEFE
tara:strand:- start:2853 stop:5012 length:2160 start_codon:yes stop_codon:yes gene_type:complete